MRGRSGVDTGRRCSGAPFDQQFIDMVVSHHEGRQLAEDILRSQDAEISRMRQWRREWFGNDATPPMNHMPMLGNMVGHAGQTMDMAADVERLRSANGAFDIAFLDAMIPHHQSAVEAGRLARCSSQRNRRSRTWRWRSSKRNSARSISCRPGASRGARPRRRNLRARHPALTDMSARRRHELLIRPGFAAGTSPIEKACNYQDRQRMPPGARPVNGKYDRWPVVIDQRGQG